MKLTTDEIKVLNANRNFDRAHPQWRRLGKLKSGWSTDR